MKLSPVPIHTTFGSDGATAMAPIEAASCRSKMGSQPTPPSLLRHRPPEAAPAYQVSGSPGTPATAETRLPIGPMWRNSNASRSSWRLVRGWLGGRGGGAKEERQGDERSRASAADRCEHS